MNDGTRIQITSHPGFSWPAVIGYDAGKETNKERAAGAAPESGPSVLRGSYAAWRTLQELRRVRRSG